MFEVTDAKREMLVGSIGFIGASGAGKTLSMLKTAYGFVKKMFPDLKDDQIWQKIGVIDTEHERSKIYAETTEFGLDIGSFKHLNFQKPFSVERLDAAIKFLKDKYNVAIIIVDSLSHFWEGEGGILDLQQQFGGNYQAWAKTNPHYAHFVSLVTGEKYQIDMLNGIRAKQHYEVTQNEVGKLHIQKMGLKPTQRDSLEYEFHIAFNIDMDHIATTMKDNSGMFSPIPQQIESEVGEKLYDWLKKGINVQAKEKDEKQEIIDKVKSFLDSKVSGMHQYVNDLIKATIKARGDLMNLDVPTLERMLSTVKAKEVELQKQVTDVVKELDDSQKKVDESNKKADENSSSVPEDENVEKLLLKDLREVAKTFNIKNYSKMLKKDLIEAIKKAQTK